MDRQSQESGTHHLTLTASPVRRPWPEPAPLQLAGIGLIAPGFASWAEATNVLTGMTPYRDRGMPPFERLRLPPNAARRLSLSMRIALEVAEEALAQATMPRSSFAGVFACSGGNAESLHKVLQTLAENAVSPNQFAQMGHHAAAGSWSIVNGSLSPTSSLGAWDGSFAAGLLEADCQARTAPQPILFVAPDVPPPPAFRAARAVTSAFAVALVLASDRSSAAGGQLRLHLTPGDGESRMNNPALEALRLNNPAARALPLLRLIACRESGQVLLPYHDTLRLRVGYAPC